MNIKISIIIPVYNVEPYIERCLLSALNQTYQNLEIILIDDCGQDNSMSVARAVAEKHPNGHKVVFLKHEQNRGLSAARNTGIEAATGDYVYFLDSDDEITLDCIETLITLTEKYNPDFVIGNITATNTNIDYSLRLKNIEYIKAEKILSLFIKGKWYDMACNKLINRKFLLDNNLFFYPGIYHEDYLWSFRMATKVNSMAVCYTPSYTYHVRENSISQTLKLKNVKDKIFILNQIKNIIDNDKKLSGNIDILRYYENLKFAMLCEFSKTEFWEYAYAELKKLYSIDCNFIKKMPVINTVKSLFILLLPQFMLKIIMRIFYYARIIIKFLYVTFIQKNMIILYCSFLLNF